MVKKVQDICNRLDTIPACDGRTDGRTSCHGIVCAMHTRRAVKTIADVCSYVDWRKISDEFKCLDQGHFLTL